MGLFDAKPNAKDQAALERQIIENGRRDAKMQRALAEADRQNRHLNQQRERRWW